MKDKRFLRVVTKAIRGDEKAFEELIRLRGRNILYIAINLMHDKADGEDVAQEAILLIRRDIGKLEKPGAFDAWMYRVVYNTCMNAKRKMSRTTASRDIDPYSLEVQEQRKEFLPAEFLDDTEKRQELINAIDDLPDHYRMCIILYYYEEMSYAEIAEVLDIKVQDVANILNRAKKKLRVALLGTEEALAAETGIQVKRSVAALPVIAAALHFDMQRTVSDSMLADMIDKGIAVTAGVGVGIGSVTATFRKNFLSNVFSKAVVVVACGCLAVGIGLGVFENLPQQSERDEGQPAGTNSQSAEPSTEANAGDTQDPSSAVDRPARSYVIGPSSPSTSSGGSSQGETPGSDDSAGDGFAVPEWVLLGSYIDNSTSYTVYGIDDIKNNKRRLMIERKGVNGSVDTVYREGDLTLTPPVGRDIVDAFEAWG